jgi:cysteate synthase
VKLVVIEDGDYPDAIELVATVCRSSDFQPEGGVKNVARRDGLATVLLSAFEEMQCLPSYYFQAVGSGTGAIAVLEAARRFCEQSEDLTMPRLMLCQNLPFTPIYEAWQTRSRALPEGSQERFRDAVRSVRADELTNWTPPYSIPGGVYDSLVASRGDVLVGDNAAVRAAMERFLELEGIDIEPAAGVAVACLSAAVAEGKVDRESVVLLNVTGGGRGRLGSDYPLVKADPYLRLTRRSLADEGAVHRLAESCLSPDAAQ